MVISGSDSPTHMQNMIIFLLCKFLNLNFHLEPLVSQKKHEAEHQPIRSTLSYKDDKTSGLAETSKEA